MNIIDEFLTEVDGLIGTSEELTNMGAHGFAPHQGTDSDHEAHPLHHAIVNAGYKYSHSNTSFDGSNVMNHHYTKKKATWQKKQKFENSVTVNSGNTNHWKSISGKHRTVEGEGASSLASHLRSANSKPKPVE